MTADTTPAKKTAPQRGGRKARLAVRMAPEPEINPCPPGQIGGQYRPLTDTGIKNIYDTALKILEEIGMGEATPLLQEKAVAAGARVNDSGRLFFSRAFVEDIIDAAPKTFTFHGRNPDHTFEVGGDRVYYGTAGAAVQTLDMDEGIYRPSTARDLYDFSRLCDTLTNVKWFSRCCVATDVEDIFDMDANTAYAVLRGTEKPAGTSFTIGEHVDPIVEMFDLVAGGEGEFAKRPFCKAHITSIISPLRYGEDAIGITEACTRHNIPVNAIVAAQSGATGPATLAGFLAQTTAEALAALIMVNLFKRGHPTVLSNWPFVIDLRTGAFCGSGGEISVMNAAAAQIGRWIGLPTGVAAAMADAKAVDAQMGVEKALSTLATGLAGANLVYESSGMMASLLGVSFEGLLLDDEMLSFVQRIIRGIEVNEETLGFEAIRSAVTGEGHFLGSPHTMDAMQRDYFYPRIYNRDQPRVWAEAGAPDIWKAANEKVRAILAEHKPKYISDSVDEKIRKRFNIVIP